MTQYLQSIPRWGSRLVCLVFVVGCEPDQFVSMGSDGSRAGGSPSTQSPSTQAEVAGSDSANASTTPCAESGGMGSAVGAGSAVSGTVARAIGGESGASCSSCADGGYGSGGTDAVLGRGGTTSFGASGTVLQLPRRLNRMQP